MSAKSVASSRPEVWGAVVPLGLYPVIVIGVPPVSESWALAPSARTLRPTAVNSRFMACPLKWIGPGSKRVPESSHGLHR